MFSAPEKGTHITDCQVCKRNYTSHEERWPCTSLFLFWREKESALVALFLSIHLQNHYFWHQQLGLTELLKYKHLGKEPHRRGELTSVSVSRYTARLRKPQVCSPGFVCVCVCVCEQDQVRVKCGLYGVFFKNLPATFGQWNLFVLLFCLKVKRCS